MFRMDDGTESYANSNTKKKVSIILGEPIISCQKRKYTLRYLGGAIVALQSMWRRLRGATCRFNLWRAVDCNKRVDTPHAPFANIPPTHPRLGLQNPCGGDCDACLAMAGASLRPRQPMHARAAAS
eukprot:4710642-Pyramimonas_sp.AAC.1